MEHGEGPSYPRLTADLSGSDRVCFKAPSANSKALSTQQEAPSTRQEALSERTSSCQAATLLEFADDP